MLFLDLKQEIGKILLLSDNPQNIEVLSEAQWMKAFGLYLSRSNPSLNPNRSLGLAWILFFRRVDFVWLLMSNSELLRIKNGQKTPYKKQKTASSYKISHLTA